MANYDNLFDLADYDLIWEAIGPDGVEDDEAEARSILSCVYLCLVSTSAQQRAKFTAVIGGDIVSRVRRCLNAKAADNGLVWCDHCKDVVKPATHITHHETREEPADGIVYCPDCNTEF